MIYALLLPLFLISASLALPLIWPTAADLRGGGHAHLMPPTPRRYRPAR